MIAYSKLPYLLSDDQKDCLAEWLTGAIENKAAMQLCIYMRAHKVKTPRTIFRDVGYQCDVYPFNTGVWDKDENGNMLPHGNNMERIRFVQHALGCKYPNQDIELTRFFHWINDRLVLRGPDYPRNLCREVELYSHTHGDSMLIRLEDALKKAFKNDGLDYMYPFNEDRVNFITEYDANSFWDNPRRIQFLKDHLNLPGHYKRYVASPVSLKGAIIPLAIGLAGAAAAVLLG